MKFAKTACLILFFLVLAACDQIPAGSLNDPDVIFHEEFAAGQTGDWQLEGDTLGTASIVNERLLIDLNQSNLMQFSTLPAPVFQDFILEVEAQQLAGDLANTYGVLFRVQDPNRFYRFEISGSGTYMLERRNGDGTWTRFVQDWTEDSAIQQGHEQVNLIRIEAVGPSITAYVNDTLVAQAQDSTYASGQIGFDAGTFGNPSQQAAFDNVVVREP